MEDQVAGVIPDPQPDQQADHQPDEQPDEQNASRPYWIPPGVDLDSFPEELQVAIVGLVNPAYRDLVLSASPGLEQSTGVTIVHLLWLEILDQLKLGSELSGEADDPEALQRRAAMIAGYLRLVGAKSKASNFLLRLHEFREKRCTSGAIRDPIRSKFPPC